MDSLRALQSFEAVLPFLDSDLPFLDQVVVVAEEEAVREPSIVKAVHRIHGQDSDDQNQPN